MLYRKHLAQAFTYKSGRPPEDLLKAKGIKKIYPLASNENYLGPSPKALEAINKAKNEIHIYPDTLCSELREKIAKLYHVNVDNTLIGAGSSELISMLYTAFLEPDERVLKPNPSFMLYKVLASFMNLQCEDFQLNPDFSYNIDTIIEKNTPKTKIIIVVSPNNPTGTIITQQQMDKLISSLRKDQILVVDEAYIEFNDAENSYDDLIKKAVDDNYEKNIIVLRTFSKVYALAGLRLGYLFAKKQIVEGFLKVLKPFTVTSLAEKAGVASLDDTLFVNKSIQLVKDGRKKFYSEFDRLNLDYTKGYGNFIFIKTLDINKVSEAFLEKGVVVRPCAQFGYEQAVRITYGDAEANDQVVKVIKENLDLFKRK